MENKYQVIALIGKAGAGKDAIQKVTCQAHPLIFNPIVSCTTRPAREEEVAGRDYHFISLEDFTRKVLNGDMLEATEFRGWFYGTPISSLDATKINIGVFNPAGVEALLEDPQLDVTVCLVHATDKERLLRYLTREEHPDCAEMCRRFLTDEKDFQNLEFNHLFIENYDGENLDLLNNEHHSIEAFVAEMWAALGVDTEFETVVRWENSMTLKATSENDKDNND